MLKRNALRFRTLYQFGFSILITVSLLIQFGYGIYVEHGITVGYIAVFFTYFTILSNIFVASVLWNEARTSYKGEVPSEHFERVRATAVFCILTTGIIYAFFLKGPGGAGAVTDSIPWINSVFHYIMPSVMAIDWLLFPPRKPAHWVAILKWLLVTIIYLAYVELIGLFTGVYPYFFLDPVTLHGYLGVLRASIAFIPFLVVIGAIIIGANRLRRLILKS
jgi:hypothetical protein